MKKLNFKKYILSIIAAVSVGLSSFALADNAKPASMGYAAGSNGGVDPNAGIVGAIKDVGNKMVGLGFASMTAFNQSMYQFDQNLLNFLNANTAAATVSQSNAATGATKTQQYIQSTFQNIPNSFESTAEEAINSTMIQNQIKVQNELINNLTLGVPASDTLYVNLPEAIAAGYGSFSPVISNYYNSKQAYTVGPSNLNRDNYFSVSSVLTPAAYTQDQLDAVNTYMDYLMQSYNNPASSIKLSDLKSYINGLKQSQQSAALYQFVSSSQYQQYQLALRSYMANKSVAVNDFEYLIAERTPSTKKVTGIYDDKGNAISNPSPLQVEQYQANSRINNPAWIQGLQQMSSSSLQREIAVELAEVIKQNQQAHMDRERLLTTLSAMQLQSNEGSKMVLNTMAEQVNDEISGLGNKNKSNSSIASHNAEVEKQAQEQAQKAAQKQQ